MNTAQKRKRIYLMWQYLSVHLSSKRGRITPTKNCFNELIIYENMWHQKTCIFTQTPTLYSLRTLGNTFAAHKLISISIHKLTLYSTHSGTRHPKKMYFLMMICHIFSYLATRYEIEWDRDSQNRMWHDVTHVSNNNTHTSYEVHVLIW